jgi:hypothetical protein
MTILVDSLINAAARDVQDLTYARWSKDTWLEFLNAAQLTVLTYRPDAFCGRSTETLVEGYKQIASTGVRKVMDVICNVDGPAITKFDKKQMDLFDPNWVMGTRKSIIKHFDWNSDEPKTYYVYPPAAAGTKVEISASLYPPVCVLAGVCSLPDEFFEALKFYLLYLAYLQESPDFDMSKANSFFNVFLSTIGAEKQARVSGSPVSSVTATEAGAP